jgi:hypothetical protein
MLYENTLLLHFALSFEHIALNMFCLSPTGNWISVIAWALQLQYLICYAEFNGLNPA